MLILSRHESDRIVFPTLAISVELLKIRGKTARLGIDAPADIPVLRDELLPRSFEMTPDRESLQDSLQQLVRTIQHRLDAAATHLNHLHCQFEDGELEEGQQTILALFNALKSLEQEALRTLEQHAAAKKHVLVVEDNVAESKMLSNMLQLWGAQVTTATDGNDALEFLSLHAAPDALIMGTQMQHCNRAEFLGRIRSLGSQPPLKVIAIGDREPGEPRWGLGSRGVDAWFSGPIDPNALLEVLDLAPADTAA